MCPSGRAFFFPDNEAFDLYLPLPAPHYPDELRVRLLYKINTMNISLFSNGSPVDDIVLASGMPLIPAEDVPDYFTPEKITTLMAFS